MSETPFKSSELRKNLGVTSLFTIANLSSDVNRYGYRSDQDRQKLIDARVYLTSNPILKSKERYEDDFELHHGQKVQEKEVKERRTECKEGWDNSTFPEAHLVRNLENIFREIPYWKVKTWHLMVLGLPSVHLRPFQHVSHRQYWLAMEIVANILTAIEVCFGRRSYSENHVVSIDTTHMTKYPTPSPGGIDQKYFNEILFDRTHHLREGSRHPLRLKTRLLSGMLGKFSSKNIINDTVLIMFKPMNPIRQLIQHLLEDRKREDLPSMIICSPGEVDNKMPQGEGYFNMLSDLYCGDRNSDLVDKFLTENYDRTDLLTDQTLDTLPDGFTDEEKQTAKDIFGTLCLFVNLNLYPCSSTEPETPPKK
ncbi:hypothetical protein N0V90_011374 [Kalmusia sp. IMI 367209]|nr:hypothetical protein N0V90_011374 [Kalmusia sp. IMI 367209]